WKARVSELITLNMIPVRLHVRKHPEAMSRFNVQWTPTVLILDSDGNEVIESRAICRPMSFSCS
ncbi:MAG TPA: hypothetical protein VIM68_10125, partial [Thermoanaerobaculia bacterium]